MNERRWTRRSLLRAGGAAAATAAGLGARDVVQGLSSAIDSPALANAPAVRLNPPDAPEPPSGGFQPGVLYTALYGHPGSQNLGILGTLSVDGAVRRARDVADSYRFYGLPVVPAFEIIASVAAANAGGDGDYSNEFGPAKFEPLLRAAEANDLHVVCDLQTGRSRFDAQAREYEFLWTRPNVSIALDPEWRFDAPGRPGGGRIGSVSAAEVNATVDYIDGLIRRDNLPPKMLIVHQFTPSMIQQKTEIRGTPNVQIVIHMDGFGSLTLKRGSYARVVSDLPAGALTGWKNFYSNDRPTPTPQQTMANTPPPSYVSYQ